MAKKYQGWYSTPAFCIERMASHLVLYITCLLDIKTKVFVFIKIHFLTLVFLNLKQERHKKKREAQCYLNLSDEETFICIYIKLTKIRQIPIHCMFWPTVRRLSDKHVSMVGSGLDRMSHCYLEQSPDVLRWILCPSFKGIRKLHTGNAMQCKGTTSPPLFFSL